MIHPLIGFGRLARRVVGDAPPKAPATTEETTSREAPTAESADDGFVRAEPGRSAPLRRPNPFMGQPSPFMGQPSPFMGQPDPFMGQPSPFMGQPDPASGRRAAPTIGTPAPAGSEPGALAPWPVARGLSGPPAPGEGVEAPAAGWPRPPGGFPAGPLGGPLAPPGPQGPERAQAALSAAAPIAADHPMRVHAETVRGELARQGLPTRADGVPIHVLGEGALFHRDAHGHGEQIARTIAGETGLAPGAELSVTAERLPSTASPDARARMERMFAAANGTADLETLATRGVDSMIDQVERTERELAGLRGETAGQGGTRIASMSWGEDPLRLGLRLANQAMGQGGNDSSLVRSINARRAERGEPPLDVTTREGAGRVRGAVIGAIRTRLEGPDAARFEAARASLAEEVARSRAAGILPIAAAGNEHAEGLPEGLDRSAISGVPGIVSVGAAALGDPSRAGDETLAVFSARGATISGVGVGLPIGPAGEDGLATDVNGTSFAAPYVASVAALMLKANPALRPDDIESILMRPEVARDIAGTTRDGAGVVDPVAAVRLARDLAVRD